MIDTSGGVGTLAVASVSGEIGVPRRDRLRGLARAALHGPSSNGRIAQATRFGWHYAQMAVAMVIGMVPLGPALSAIGHPNLDSQSPQAYALAMTASMLLPMIAWMRILGHSWERTAEMSAAMTVPTVVVAAGSVSGPFPSDAALSVMNIVMWVGMLGAMLVRWSEYAQGCHNHATSEG